MKPTLIISVYKNTEALKAVLDDLQYQTFKDFDVLISEDGDSDVMRDFLASYSSSYSIHHSTQPDNGWQKNKALNNAIRRAKGDYLIFIDGDCVLHPHFIEAHIEAARPKKIVAGKRVKLGPKFSEYLVQKGVNWVADHYRKEYSSIKKDGGRFLEEGFYFGKGLLSFIPKLRSMYQLKGCNMSGYKAAFEDINGFDEDYVRPAIGEDIDLVWRFEGLGYKLASVRNLAVQYHIHHKENWTSQDENVAMMEEKKAKKLYRCLNGLEKIN